VTITSNSSAIVIPLNAATKPTTATPAPDTGKKSFEAVRERVQRQIASDGKLIATTKLIGIAISWYMNGKLSGEARPGIDTLAAVTATPRRSVIRAIKDLEGRHYDVRRSKKPDGTRAVNRYFPILKSLAPGATHDTRPSATDDTRHRVPNNAKPGAKSCESRVPPTALEPPIDEPPIEPPRERASAFGLGHFPQSQSDYSD